MPRFRSGGAYGKYFVLRRRYRGTDLQLDGGLLGVDLASMKFPNFKLTARCIKRWKFAESKKTANHFDDFGKSEPDFLFCFLDACAFRITFCQSFR